MSILLDLIVVAVFATSLIVGICKGFIRSVMGIAVLIATVILASSFAAPLGRYIDGEFVHGAVLGEVEKALDSFMDDTDETDLDTLYEVKRAAFVEMLERFHVDFAELKNNFDPETDDMTAIKAELAEYITTSVSTKISKAIAFAILFIGLFILLTIVMHLLNLLFKLPVLNGTNKLLGGIFGGVRGFIFAWGLSAVFCFLMPHLAVLYEETFSPTVIENTYLVKLLGNFDVFKLL